MLLPRLRLCRHFKLKQTIGVKQNKRVQKVQAAFEYKQPALFM
nr:hypothetical protein [Kingella kingae]